MSKKIKMTATDKKNGKYAGLVYLVTNKEAKDYTDRHMAIELKESEDTGNDNR